ncbi:MAG: RNA polymerase sigma factor [Candidatus Pacebacteria bacterium]|nr:RNA polymerase sigma factor [Candidatus Paceibacterota bacterium]
MLEDEIKYIKDAQKGNKKAFGVLYNHYLPKIYRFVFLKVSSKSSAEDLSHEVFLNAWKNINSYVHREFPFSSWLYQLARNEVIDFYRTTKKNISLEDILEEPPDTKIDEGKIIDSKLNIEKIKSLIPRLSQNQQDVLIMRFVEDLSPEEIAAIIGKSVGAVRLIQHRALNSLKQLYGKNNRDIKTT